MRRAVAVHGDRYDYSKTNYISSQHKITIICRIHGEFEQYPRNHIHRKSGCQKCNLFRSMVKDTRHFIKKARKIHRNKYDYSKVDYKRNDKNVIIICPIHGEFKQRPYNHYNGKGCPQCGIENGHLLLRENNSTKNRYQFLLKSRRVHGDKYDYSKVDYKNSYTKVEIICPTHGGFISTPQQHVAGRSCPKCARLAGNKKKLIGIEKFIKKARAVHGDRYDYSRTVYRHSQKRLKIVCPTHGEFEQVASDHLKGHGCPTCSYSLMNNIPDSSGQKEVEDFILQFGNDVIINDRSIIPPYELDLYFPRLNLAIEFNGDYWHSHGGVENRRGRNRHKDKCDACESIGIQLIQIAEYEWLYKRKIIEKILRFKFGEILEPPTRYDIVELDNKKYKSFMGENSIRGHKPASLKYGLICDRRLTSIMSFRHKDCWELIGFVNCVESTVDGFSELFERFVHDNNPEMISTIIDRRYHMIEPYVASGFKINKIIGPNYCYVKGHKTYNRYGFRKNKLKDKLKKFDPGMTKADNMFNNGYRRLWDAGHYKLIWRKEWQ